MAPKSWCTLEEASPNLLSTNERSGFLPPQPNPFFSPDSKSKPARPKLHTYLWSQLLGYPPLHSPFPLEQLKMIWTLVSLCQLLESNGCEAAASGSHSSTASRDGKQCRAVHVIQVCLHWESKVEQCWSHTRKQNVDIHSSVEWGYVCVDLRNWHQKHMCFKEIGLCVQNMLTVLGSKFNRQRNSDSVDLWVLHEHWNLIFTLILNRKSYNLRNYK